LAFVHLQVSTAYSLLSSTISISKWVQQAKKFHYDTLAITDRNVLYGTISFYNECKKNGIKPIIGLTADVVSPVAHDQGYPLVLLAKDETGYQNLLKISSTIQTKSPQGILLNWLRAYSEGLFAISPGIDGEIEQYVLQGDMEKAETIACHFKQIFGEDSFFLSLQQHQLEEENIILPKIVELSEKIGVKTIVTNNVQYLSKDDAFAHECLLTIKAGMKLSDENRPKLFSEEYYFKSQDEMNELFFDYKEALLNTEKVAAACNLEIKMNQRLLPKYPLEDGRSADQWLEQLCREGLAKRIKDVNKVYEDRLQYELEIIQTMQFSDYFLIVWDFMKYAREKGIITGPGRGSAAGSLVAYVLYITDVDPIKHELLFERFLNPERITMPDIDSDFPDHRRDEMIQYVAKKYGQLHVAQIITFGTFAAKAAARDVARIFGFNSKEMEYLSRIIPSQLGMTLKQAYQESEQLRQFIQESQLNRKLFETALRIEGLPRHASTHAAGVIISDKPLVHFIPIQDGHEGVYLTQFPMNHLEEIGLLKMDFLGLRNLTILEQILTNIRKGTGKMIRLQEIPLNDSKTFELLSKGNTTGVFQLESDGMRKVLQLLKPTELEDIVAVNALYRPGPMENISVYIKRKHGEEPVFYAHEDLKPILEKTYGVIVYQEQIMQIASKMAGFTLGEADLLRRAVSKKKKEALDRERNHFINGALKKGYDEKMANHIYDLIIRFANYGFNRSHAVAYSFIAYQLAYLKAHYPVYFMASLLTSVIGNEDKISQYVREAQQMGIEILPPSINHSYYSFAVEKGAIRFSLAAIKGIGYASLKDIMKNRSGRPFSTLFDLCLRVKGLNRKILESFILAGALDDFNKDRAVLLASIDVALEHADVMRPLTEEGDLFFDDESLQIEPNYAEAEPMPLIDKLTYEKQFLGLYLTDHPVRHYRSRWEREGFATIESLQFGKRKFHAGVYVNDVKTIRTKKGEMMAFLKLSDETGEIEGVVFPKTYNQYHSVFQKDDVIVIEGTVENRNEKAQLIVQKIIDMANIHNVENKETKLFLRIPSNAIKTELLIEIKQLLNDFQGSTPVILHYEDDHQTIQLSRKDWVNPTSHFLNKLIDLLGSQNVILK